MDWKGAISSEGERRRCEKEALCEAERKKKQAELAEKYSRLAQRFKCHCCGVGSAVPGDRCFIGPDPYILYQGGYDSVYEYAGENWGRPGDLAACEHCGYLTCSQCLYQGICRKCGEAFARGQRPLAKKEREERFWTIFWVGFLATVGICLCGLIAYGPQIIEGLLGLR